MSVTSPQSEQPLVAIVTPVYNGAAHLEACIRAVQAQTYRPLVHCIVDNASTDGTAEIIARHAQTEIPIVTARNASTIPFQANFNAVLELIPPAAKYFRMLHADDGMPPDAIEKMMNLVGDADDIVMVTGRERLNGADRHHHFPPEQSIMDARTMLARTLSDEAHVPCVHVLYHRSTLRQGEEFYPTDTIECAVEAVNRTLSRGGRAGFVHAHIANTARDAAAGSLITTLAPKLQAKIWEKLLVIERYGPAVLSNSEYARVRTRFLRVFYRRLLWWLATGRGHLVNRDVARLRERGAAPGPWDYAVAVAVWPAYLFNKRVSRPQAPKPWPRDAIRD